MPDETGEGGGRAGRVGRGGRGFETSGSGSGAGSPANNDFNRLAGMLEFIGRSLESLIHLRPPLLPPELREEFIVVWPQTQREINLVVGRLRRELPLSKRSRETLYPRLQAAGLAGPMLKMKQNSLNFHLNGLREAVRNYSSEGSPVLTLPEDEGLIRRLLKLVKPASKVMNSVMGSVPAIVFPGKELVKEVKEHVEAGYEAAEIYRET